MVRTDQEKYYQDVCLSEKSEPRHSRKQNKTDQQQETAMTKSNRNKKDKNEWMRATPLLTSKKLSLANNN